MGEHMGIVEKRIFACDFETTVYKGQTSTEVWSSALVELGTEDVIVHHSINQTFSWLCDLRSNVLLYYHNLKFDGSFWLDYLLRVLGFEQAIHWFDEEHRHGEWLDNKDMPNNSFKYSISNMGQWYTMTIKVHGKIIEIRDSLKLLPFSLKEIGKGFNTKHQKLDMEYEGFRYAGCPITDEEMDYIKNDVLVLKEALEIMFADGHDKLTIGACCLSEFKKPKDTTIWNDEKEYTALFPDLTEIGLDEHQFGSENIDRYIRNSYGGGWCYVVEGKECKRFYNGSTADVNSLYPSVMHSRSGNRYPVGHPTFWKGNFIPDEALCKNRYYFVRIKTRFYIKKDHLPFIHIRNRSEYKSNECLKTSDYKDPEDGKYYKSYYDVLGNEIDTRVTLTLTMTDYQLLLEHYYLEDCEILDGCWFSTEIGLFDAYIDPHMKTKMESKGAPRQEAKLFLNNLYGKLASSTDSSFKYAWLDEETEQIKMGTIEAHDKQAGYIPIGSAITSYARNFTIRTAQKNYYGVDKAGFIYADTDSIHCDLPVDKLIDVPVHPTDLCCWKIENNWDVAWFARQKTYIEHVVAEDEEPVDDPYYLIKCAGMPRSCKRLLELSMEDSWTLDVKKELDKMSDEALEFLEEHRSLEDFDLGLKIPDKLMPKRIKGGVLLIDTTYEMR